MNSCQANAAAWSGVALGAPPSCAPSGTTLRVCYIDHASANPKRGPALKICIVTYEYRPEIGGLGKSARRIAKFLRQLGEVHVLAACRSLPEGTIIETREDEMNIHRI